jgi:hypothetical protein
MSAMPTLTPEALTVLAVAGLGLALIGLLLAAAGLVQARRARRALTALEDHYRLVMTGAEGQDLAAALATSGRRLAALEGRATSLDARVAQLDERLGRAVTRVRLSRYRAFEDAGGDQSFALALLDEAANGAVLSGIHGRGGMRMYAKPVAAGASSYNLTDEEARVIAAAGEEGG